MKSVTVQAGIYLLFYILLASLPLLVGIYLFTILEVLCVYFCVVIVAWLVVLCLHSFCRLVTMPMFIVRL